MHQRCVLLLLLNYFAGNVCNVSTANKQAHASNPGMETGFRAWICDTRKIVDFCTRRRTVELLHPAQLAWRSRTGLEAQSQQLPQSRLAQWGASEGRLSEHQSTPKLGRQQGKAHPWSWYFISHAFTCKQFNGNVSCFTQTFLDDTDLWLRGERDTHKELLEPPRGFCFPAW